MKIFSQLILALSFASFATAQSYTTDVMSFNPIAYWPLGGNTTDTTGHSGPLSPTASGFSSQLTPPTEPASAMFGLPTDVLALPAASSGSFGFTTTSKFSAMAWIKTVRQDNGSSAIMAKFDPAAGNGWGVVIDNGDLVGPQNVGRVAFVFVSGGNPVIGIEAVFASNDGNWHFVAVTSDGTGLSSGLHLYVDGQIGSSAPIPSASSGPVANSVPFTIGNVPDGSSPFEGNIAGVAVFNTTLTAQQIAQLAEDANTAKAILSQFAFGGGWYSAVYFTNAGLGTVSFTVNFFNDNGGQLIIPSLNASKTVVTLAPGASTIIEAPNNSPNLQQGFVLAALPIFVTGYGVFRQSVTGIADQEAVVPLASQGAGNVLMLYDETNGLATAFALVNGSTVVNNVTMTVTDSNGNVVGTAVIPPMQPLTKIENVLSAYVPKVTGTRGTVRFVATAGAANVIGIRFDNTAFSSIPALSNHQLSLFIGVQ